MFDSYNDFHIASYDSYYTRFEDWSVSGVLYDSSGKEYDSSSIESGTYYAYSNVDINSWCSDYEIYYIYISETGTFTGGDTVSADVELVNNGNCSISVSWDSSDYRECYITIKHNGNNGEETTTITVGDDVPLYQGIYAVYLDDQEIERGYEVTIDSFTHDIYIEVEYWDSW